MSHPQSGLSINQEELLQRFLTLRGKAREAAIHYRDGRRRDGRL